MSNIKKNVPELRFPGFEGEWVFVKAEELFENSSLKGELGLPIYSVTLFDGMVKRDSLDRVVEDISEPKGNRQVKKGEIAYNMMRMWQGALGVAKEDCMVSPSYVVLKPVKNVLSSFYFRIFKTKKYLYLLTSHSQGITSDRLRLYYKDFAQIKLPFTMFSEQIKVDIFFNFIDSKIELLTKKKELMEQYKKGMMQKIFSQEIRFKADDGNDYPDWEEKKLVDITEISNGCSLDQNEQKKGIKVSRIETISNGHIDPTRIGYVQTDINTSKYKILYGDILFSNINSVKHIGKNAIFEDEYDFYHGMNLLRLKSLKIHSKFLYYYLNTFSLKKHFQRVCNQAVSQASINQTELGKTLIVYPNHDEQKKIANFLASIDDKITVIDNELSSVKVFKKGLLQKMFV